MNQMDKNTWQYAKRQVTWFKKYNPNMHWIENPASPKLRRASKNEAIDLVKRFLEN